MSTAVLDLPQGSLELLDTDVAQTLLAAAIPARVAFTATDGTPRIVPTWFRWTGSEAVMPTFIAAPHVSGPSRRIAALRARPDVAVSIDTEQTPSQALLLRGQVDITEVDGIDPDFANAAHHYLGAEGADDYLGMADQPGTRMARIALRPTWVGLLDFDGGRLPDIMSGR